MIFESLEILDKLRLSFLGSPLFSALQYLGEVSFTYSYAKKLRYGSGNDEILLTF